MPRLAGASRLRECPPGSFSSASPSRGGFPRTSSFRRAVAASRGLLRAAACIALLATAAPASAQTNNPATGAPVIQGTAQVGETLTYSTSSISDPDGWNGSLDSANWYRVDSDGTSNQVNVAFDAAEYTLVEADVGKKIGLESSLIDERGHRESFVSVLFPSTGTVVAAPASTDATLSALALTAGTTSTPVALSPVFASGTTTGYRAWVVNSVSSVTVTATKNDSNATVAIANDDDTGTPGSAVLSLSEGRNTVTVTVTAEDGSTTKTYTATAVRVASAPTADPNALLTANVTVGETSGVFGYFQAVSPGWGAMTDDDFVVGGSTYRLWGVLVMGGTGVSAFPADTVTACFTNTPTPPTTAVRDKLVLSIDGHDFPLAGTTLLPGASTNCYSRSRSALTPWAWGDVATVKIAALNNAPVITTTSPQSVAENTTAVVTLAATDADGGDTHTWSLNGGDDAGKFTLTGKVLTFTDAPDFENPADTGTDNGYAVNVRVNDGTANVDLALTVNVTDVAEKPAKPATPTVSATTGSTTSLDVDWDKPGLNGGPDITGYNVQYRVGTSGAWTDVTFSGTDTETKITGRTAGTEHQARVQAINGETDSDWSDPGTGSTNAPANAAPVFPAGASTRELTENVGANVNVGAPVSATDADTGDTLTYSFGGTDVGKFNFNTSTQQITTKTGQTYDYETDTSYTVTVTATDGTTPTTVTVTINVLNLPAISIAPVRARVLLTDDAATFVVSGSPAPAGNLTVPVTVQQEHAWIASVNIAGRVARYNQPDDEWESPGFALLANAPAKSGDLTVTLQPGDGYEIGTATATIEIVGADPLITVRAAAASYSPGEGDGTVTVTLTAETIADAPKPRGQAFSVNWSTTAGTATGGGTDFENSNGTVRFISPDFAQQGDRWVLSKDVEVTLVDDGVKEETEQFHVTLTRHSTLHPLIKLANADRSLCKDNAAGVNCGTTVTILDNEPGVTISKTALDIMEGGTGTYTVVLRSQPTATVTVTPSRTSGDTDITVSGALMFTTTTWDDAQTVTVSAAEDDSDSVVDTAVIGHAVSGGNYASVMAASVTVTAADNDAPNVPATGKPTISGTAQVGQTLTAAKGSIADGNGLTKADNDETGFAYTYQWIRVDSDGTSNPMNVGTNAGTYTLAALDEDKKIKVEVSFHDDNGYAETRTSDPYPASETVLPSSAVSLLLSPASIRENGGTTRIRARLNVESSADTTVTVSVEPVPPAVAGDYTLSANTVLTIPVGRTVSTGLVTLTAVNNDVDADDKTVTILGDAENSAGVGGPVEETLTIEDDDRGVRLSPTSLTIDEGRSKGYTVVLGSRPTGSVTVRPQVPPPAGMVTVSGPLVFTQNNWNEPQTVTVTAGQDEDEEDETVQVTHLVSGADYGGFTAGSVRVMVSDDDGGTGVLEVGVYDGSDGAGVKDPPPRVHFGQPFRLDLVWSHVRTKHWDNPEYAIGPTRAIRAVGGTVRAVRGRFSPPSRGDHGWDQARLTLEITPEASDGSDDVTLVLEPLDCSSNDARALCAFASIGKWTGLAKRVRFTVRGITGPPEVAAAELDLTVSPQERRGTDMFLVSFDADEEGTRFRLQMQNAGGDWTRTREWTGAMRSENQHRVTVDGVSHDDAYEFRVRWENDFGPGPWAQASTAGAAPAAPTGLRLTPMYGAKSLALAWTPVTQAGVRIERFQYRIERIRTEELVILSDTGPIQYLGNWVDIPNSGTVGANYRSWTIGGLANIWAAKIRVRAVSASGRAGAASAEAVAAVDVPRVADISMASDPGADGYYTYGNRIGINVRLSRPVRIPGNDRRPSLDVEIGGGVYNMGLVSIRQSVAHELIGQAPWSGDVLFFEHSLGTGDVDHNGIRVPAGALKGNGGRLLDLTPAGEDQLADLAVSTAKAFPAHKVNTVPPRIVRMTWQQNLHTNGVVRGAEVRIHYDRDLDPNSRLNLDWVQYRVAYSESRALGRSVTGLSIGDATDDGVDNPRTVRLVLAPVVHDPDGSPHKTALPHETVTVTYSGMKVSGNTGRRYGPFDTLGNPLAGFTRAAEHTAPPLAVSAEVHPNGRTVHLTFDGLLNRNRLPSPRAFTVTVNGAEATIGTLSVSADGRKLTLPVSGASIIRQGQTVRVAYGKPGSGNVLEGTNGLDVADFTRDVTNNSTVTATDTGVGPALVSAEFNSLGRVLTLNFDEDVQLGSPPSTSDITVTVGDNSYTARNRQNQIGSLGSFVRYLFAGSVNRGQTVTVSYSDPNPGINDADHVFQDADGNDGPSFTNFPVRNRSTQTSGSLAPPEPLTAAFENVPASHGGNAFTFRLAFSEEFPVEADTVRGALTVTGGSITTVAQSESGKNRNWQVTVTPTALATPVTLSLVPKESCTDAGAICTAENRGIAEAIEAEIAGIPPTVVTGVAVTNGPGENGVWDTGETVEAEVRFSGPVGNYGPPGGGPTLGILLDGTRREAAYTGGNATDTFRFSYTVTAADDGARKARVAPNGLTLGSYRLTVNTGGEADPFFSTAPYATSVELVADGSGDSIWTAGETIEVRLTFNEAVTVADGTPRVGVETTDNVARTLDYASGSGSATLVFSRAVTAADGSLPGIEVSANSLALNGASIVSEASGLAAELGHGGTGLMVLQGRIGEEAIPLTAAFADLPASHGGAAFTFELRFSEAFPIGYETMRDSAFTVTNGHVTGARRLDNPHRESVRMEPNRVWEITVEPGTDAEDVSITLPETTDCAGSGAVCTEDGRALSAAIATFVPRTVPVTAPPPPPGFTVRFEDFPSEHDGTSAVVFKVMFNKKPANYSYRTMRDNTLLARQGSQAVTPKQAKRLNAPHSDQWRITIEPASKADMHVEIRHTTSCAETGAVCTDANEQLANRLSKTILGPPGLSVADARVEEAANATVDFAVTLSRASSSTVTVGYATSDGTATAGSDYTQTSGTLTFAPGDTAKTVSVPVLDDAHDEDHETFTFTLSEPSGGNAWLSDATATGTIENTDKMPQAWLARFGRTVADQVIDAVQGRMQAQPRPGVAVSLAGQAIGANGSLSGVDASEPDDADARATLAEETDARSRLETMSKWLQGENEEDDRRAGFQSRSVTERDLLTGTSFSLTGEAAAGGRYASLWGRGAVSSFDGREGDLTLDGQVTTAMLGADWTRDAWTAGLLVSHSRGDGSYRGEGEGEVESALTGLYPYGRYAVSGRVTVWGVAGFGSGTLTLTPKNPVEGEDDRPIETGMSLMMGAVGARGVMIEAPAEGGPELAVKSDAMMVRTSSKAVRGNGETGAGNLAAADADVTRLRLGLEGSWRGIEAGGGELTPRLEIGVRHDGGDAETGFGLDLGGGLAWSHPASGLTAEVSGRGLLSHEAGGFRDRGISGSLGWDPRPETERGVSLTLTQTLGAPASGGMDALLSRGTLTGLAANDEGEDALQRRRLELRLGYGFSAFEDRFTSTPEIGLGLSDSARDYSLGWRLGLDQSGPNALELRLKATRRESANDNAEPEHGIGFKLTARW